MKTLYVLYDAKCALCRSCRQWLTAQPAFVTLRFIPLQSPEVGYLFPGIEALNTGDQLIAVSDEGDVYTGPQAWIICLYALQDYREWSVRLAQPALLPFARRAFELLSKNRLSISKWLPGGGEGELRERLTKDPLIACEVGGACENPQRTARTRK